MDGAVPLIALLLVIGVPIAILGLVFSSVTAFRKNPSPASVVRARRWVVLLIALLLALLLFALIAANSVIGYWPATVLFLNLVWSLILIARLNSKNESQRVEWSHS